MIGYRNKRLISIVLSIFALSGTTPSSWANGSWPSVIGARTGAMGGAGVAFITDPAVLSLNPALGAAIGNALTLVPAYSVFDYQVDGKALGLPKQGNIARDIPGILVGFNYHTSNKITAGITLLGSGGPTQFQKSPIVHNSIAPSLSLNASALLTFPVSYAFNESFSVGISPLVGYLVLRTNASEQSPWMPNDSALGIGARFGAQYTINQQFSIGAALQTPIEFQKLRQYADILPNNTQLPVIALIGTVWHMSPATDILLDFEEIYWASTSSSGQLPPIPGSAGWRDSYDIKVGGQHQFNETITLRAGYQYGPVVIPEKYVFPYNVFNTASTLTEHTVTGGVGYQPSIKDFSVDLATVYGFPSSITDNGVGPLGTAAEGYTIKGSYVAVLVGFNWKFH